MKKSNCLIAALIIRFRIGGRLNWRRSTYSSAEKWKFLPGHWYIVKNGRKIDFHSDADMTFRQLLWFEGAIRVRRLKEAVDSTSAAHIGGE